MKNVRNILAAAASMSFALFAVEPSLADDATSGLAGCAAVADDAQRLACFDALAAHHAAQQAERPAPASAAPVPVPAPGPAPPAAAGPIPVTDDVGRERVEGGQEEERPVYSANVIRCEENQQSGQTYFFFENGQVWKQANYRRLRFRECRFDITLTEDNFGYSMFIPSEDRRIRVTRIR